MIIPRIFIDAQKIFQDKKVFHHKAQVQKDSLGTEFSMPEVQAQGEYLMNFCIISDVQKANEWGLQSGIDAESTISEHAPIEKGDFLKYKDKFYKVVAKHEHDAYTRFICKAVE